MVRIGFLIAVFLAVVVIAGCLSSRASSPTTTTREQISERSSKDTVGNLRLLATLGALLMAGGVITMALSRERTQGLVMALGGAAMMTLYVQFSEHPILSAVAVGIPVAGWAVATFAKIKARIMSEKSEAAFCEVVAAVELHPEVKHDIGGGDPLRQEAVREVVSPIKHRLKLTESTKKEENNE